MAFVRRRLLLAAGLLLLPAATACKAKPTGELVPPSGAAAWESRFSVAYDDAYTRERVSLSGRAPNDVRDQSLFAARMGHADIVAVVTVKQVWGRGRYQGRQDQYLDVELGDTLLGELPRKVSKDQLLKVIDEDELPGSLQGAQMVMFLRWAPEELPPYHHHLMPADDETLAWIKAMVDHAREEGVLDASGEESRRAKRRRRQGKSVTKKKRGKAKADAGASE